MKFAVITIAAIVAMMNVVTGTIAGVDMSASDPATTVLSQSKALEAAKHNSMPDGVEFTGSIEQIDQPADAKEILEAMQTKHDDADNAGKQEGFGWGHGRRFGWGHGGWGSWGGWAGFGPYRFGFRCGGVPGWAYPLSYWNIFGVGLYGGGCSLGMPFGGLYYC
ncbi:unnamed protein product [Peronospora farinosa]|uniref:Uncharacterized protein n=1 Tax=Peronospora farinosa TaxID=134698 RepID=A0AAV0TPU3_9STRA|nr:unnamed protein product [Peronospora farinosa]CAI5725444.1 unnamed protein product [Peronospora farinosa]CAI5725471.1 unnamed protein product [Peronospora farinosa]